MQSLCIGSYSHRGGLPRSNQIIDFSNRKPREGEVPEVLKARSQHGHHRLHVAGTSKTNRSDALAQQAFQGKRTAVLGSL
jgi:hypothetical protein